MAYVPMPLTPGMWGLDTSAKLTPALLDKLVEVDLHDHCPAAPAGTYPAFLGRYVPLPGNAPGQDIDAAELAAIADHNFLLLLFQHVRSGDPSMHLWTASPQQGAIDAARACAYARAVGYAPVAGYPPPAIVKDMEAVVNPGPAALACMSAYMRVLQAAGYQAPGYCGFASGLTPAMWASLNTPVLCDAGSREPPPGRGFALKQHAEVTLFGVRFDVDEVLVDLTGASLVAMGDVYGRVDEPPEPHLQPADPAA